MVHTRMNNKQDDMMIQYWFKRNQIYKPWAILYIGKKTTQEKYQHVSSATTPCTVKSLIHTPRLINNLKKQFAENIRDKAVRD